MAQWLTHVLLLSVFIVNVLDRDICLSRNTWKIIYENEKYKE
jgi:hypothetical protein